MDKAEYIHVQRLAIGHSFRSLVPVFGRDLDIINFHELKTVVAKEHDIPKERIAFFTDDSNKIIPEADLVAKYLVKGWGRSPAKCFRVLLLEPIIKSTSVSQLMLNNPWESKGRSRAAANIDFKTQVALYYGANNPASKRSGYTETLQCLMTSTFLPSGVITAAHLLPASTPLSTVQKFGLLTCIDHPRNGLLLYKPLEHAFDTGRITFITNHAGNTICLVIDPGLKDLKFSEYWAQILGSISARELRRYEVADELIQGTAGLQSFGDLHGRALTFREGVQGP